MTEIPKGAAHLAGRMLKVLRLANEPGMDEVAIKLNSGLTYQEQKEAETWAKAFELAIDNTPGNERRLLFELAAQLREKIHGW